MTALTTLLVLLMLVSDPIAVTPKYNTPVLYRLRNPSQFQLPQIPHSISNENEGEIVVSMPALKIKVEDENKVEGSLKSKEKGGATNVELAETAEYPLVEETTEESSERKAPIRTKRDIPNEEQGGIPAKRPYLEEPPNLGNYGMPAVEKSTSPDQTNVNENNKLMENTHNKYEINRMQEGNQEVIDDNTNGDVVHKLNENSFEEGMKVGKGNDEMDFQDKPTELEENGSENSLKKDDGKLDESFKVDSGGPRNEQRKNEEDFIASKDNSLNAEEVNKNPDGNQAMIRRRRMKCMKDKRRCERIKSILERNNTKLRLENIKITSEKENLENNFRRIDDEKKKMDGNFFRLIGEKSALEVQTANLEVQKENFEKSFLKLDEEKRILEVEYNNLLSEKAAIQSERDALRGEKAKLENIHSKLEQDFSNLEGAFEVDRLKFSDELTKLNEEKKKLEGKYMPLVEEKSAMEVKIAMLENDQMHLNQMNKKYKDYVTQIDEKLLSDTATFQKEYSEVHEKMMEVEDNYKRLSDEKVAVEMEKSKLEADNANLLENNSHMKKDIKKLEDEKEYISQKSEGDLKQLNRNYDNLLDSKHSIEMEKSKLAVEKANLEENNSKLHKESSQMKHEFQNVIERLQEDFEKLRDYNVKLEVNCKKIEDDKLALEREASIRLQEEVKFDKYTSNLAQENSDLKEALENGNSNFERLSEDIKKMEENCTLLEEEKLKIENEISKLEKEKTANDEYTFNLKQHLSRLDDEFRKEKSECERVSEENFKLKEDYGILEKEKRALEDNISIIKTDNGPFYEYTSKPKDDFLISEDKYENEELKKSNDEKLKLDQRSKCHEIEKLYAEQEQELENVRATLEQHTSNLEQDCFYLNKTLEIEQLKYKDLEEKYEYAKSKLNELNDEKIKLEQSNKRLEIEKLGVEQEHEDVMAILDHYSSNPEENIFDSGKTLQIEKLRYKDLDNKNKKLQDDYKKLEEEKKNLHLNILDLKENKTLKEDNSKLKEDFLKLEKVLQTYQKELFFLRDSKRKSDDNYKKIKDELTKLDLLEVEKAVSGQHIPKFELEMMNLKTDIRKLIEEKTKLEEKCNNLEEETVSDGYNISNPDGPISKLQKINEDLEKDKLNCNVFIQKVKDVNSKLKKNNNLLIEENSKLKMAREQHNTSSITQLKNEIIYHKTRNTKLQTVNRKVKVNNRNLAYQKKMLEKKMRTEQIKCDEATLTCIGTQTKFELNITQLKDKIHELEAEIVMFNGMTTKVEEYNGKLNYLKEENLYLKDEKTQLAEKFKVLEQKRLHQEEILLKDIKMLEDSKLKLEKRNAEIEREITKLKEEKQKLVHYFPKQKSINTNFVKESKRQQEFQKMRQEREKLEKQSKTLSEIEKTLEDMRNEILNS